MDPHDKRARQAGGVSRNRAVGYARVSTEQQAESGLSLEHQETKIRAMAAVLDAELADVIVDGGHEHSHP
jgi:DNA invertase Pin-like site-specific DNA recombinase